MRIMNCCLLILFAISALPGCGQKGDLFLEEPQPAPVPQKKTDQNKDEAAQNANQ